MHAARLRCVAILLVAWITQPLAINASELPEPAIRSVMAQAEDLLTRSGVRVVGYKDAAPPTVELVPPDHIFLRGNDGAYVAGRIYLNAKAIEDCQGLNLLHEIVHDVTVRYELFKSVSNAQVRRLIEALADEITEAAAESPYRPGCVTHRHVDISKADLVSLAMR